MPAAWRHPSPTQSSAVNRAASPLPETTVAITKGQPSTRTYSKSTGWWLMPFFGGAIQLANLPVS